MNQCGDCRHFKWVSQENKGAFSCRNPFRMGEMSPDELFDIDAETEACKYFSQNLELGKYVLRLDAGFNLGDCEKCPLGEDMVISYCGCVRRCVLGHVGIIDCPLVFERFE